MFGRKAKSSVRLSFWSRLRAAARIIRGRFDAAATDAGNERHWAEADNLSADAAASPRVRRDLRNRARYESENNGYLKGILKTKSYDMIGRGPRLQLLIENKDVANEIETKFAQWAKDVRLARKMRTMVRARVRDGECFAILKTNENSPNPVKLDVQLVEAEQVTSDFDLVVGSGDARDIDGIVLDEFGGPIFYKVLKHHPGSSADLAVDPNERELVPARFMLHWFDPDRPGQHRGVTELQSSLEPAAKLRRYTLAVVEAAEQAANISGVLYTDAPAADGGTACEPWEEIQIERNTFLSMPDEWKMAQLKAEQPTTTFFEFVKSIINFFARPLCMPFNKAAGNSSEYNYASGRLDHQDYFQCTRVERSDIDCDVTRVFAEWYSEAVLIEGYLSQEARNLIGPDDYPQYPPHEWHYDGFKHVDPEKEAKAQENRLAVGTSNHPDEYAEQGKDWEMEFTKAARSLGVTLEEYQALVRQRLFGGGAIQPSEPQPDDDESSAEEREEEPAEV